MESIACYQLLKNTIKNQRKLEENHPDVLMKKQNVDQQNQEKAKTVKIKFTIKK